jgi:methyl-accepting chemotaxis protein
VPIALWIILAVAAVAFVGGAAMLVTHAFRVWRTFRHFTRSLSRTIADVERRANETEEHARKAAEGATRLAEATKQLEESLATLAVLREAAGEFTSTIASVHGAVPGK